MRKTKAYRFLAEWLALTAASLLLFWALWYGIGRFAPGQGADIAAVITLDVAYCAVLSLCVMAVCSGFTTLLSRWMERRWAFLVASVGSLAANIAVVHLLEYLIDACLQVPHNDPSVIKGLYICGIIATTLSILLLSNTHYRLYAGQVNARLLQEQTVLRQRLEIEKLQKALEKASAEKQPTIEVEALLAQIGVVRRQYRTRFLAPVVDGVTVVEASDISHITIEGERLVACLADGKSVRLEETSLDTVEALLDPADFFRANRQYIVNIKSIARLSNFFNQTKILRLRAYPDLEIKVSKDKYGQLREWVNR